VSGFTRAQLDVTDAAAVLSVMSRERPEVIVHAAAWTAVDACEGDVAKAMLFNGTATEHVVSAARKVDARVVYISTDYVFDGTKATAYVESDIPNPQSVYGVSKLAGERAVDTSVDSIVRISWVCGYHGSNMVKTILRLVDQHDTLTFVDDQVGNPTMADDAARMIVRLAEGQRGGTWHVTNQGVVSWYEFTREVLHVAGLDPDRVKPVKTRDLIPPRPAPRPFNSVLENRALMNSGIPLLDDFRVPLSRLVHRLRLG
jgi:dTDP-4-dehydrorhamnose reductase